MTFSGFTHDDFAVFHIDGLEQRMTAIRERIQPKFRELGAALLDDLSERTGHPMHVHIAQHLRRKTNAPKDTWLAFSHSKRGYKMHPHFQIGLFDDRLFIWFALIYELPSKSAMAEHYLSRLDQVISAVPRDYQLSYDHMQKDAVHASSLDHDGWEQALRRFRDVKKAELLIGRQLAPSDPLLQSGDALAQAALSIFETLLPLYFMALQAAESAPAEEPAVRV